MARRSKATLFPFANGSSRPHQRNTLPPDEERPAAQPGETRREAVLEKLLRRAMRRTWTVSLPDDEPGTIEKDRASVCRLLRMSDPLRERND